MRPIPEKLRSLLEAPEPVLLEAGAGGERLVAISRLVFWSFIGLAPLSAVLTAGPNTPLVIWIALCTVLVAIGLSALVAMMLRRGVVIRHMGFITGAGDVTLLTLMLVVVALVGMHPVAINSQISWVVYLLAILGTTLRFDVRICLFVGLVAIVEYTLLVVWVISHWDMPVAVYAPYDGASTSVVLQTSRVVLMMAATVLAVGMVYRSRQLVYAAVTDPLTGLGNRTYFEERSRAELARASRTAAPLTLAVLDLDRFKQFNDKWGHDKGDRALKQVARVMRQESRKEDIVARWGGEEFAFVLPETDIVDAFGKMERIRTRLKSEPMTFGGDEVSLTVSCGLSEFPTDGEDANTLFAKADLRLLAAKRAGRDRTVMDEGNAAN